METGHFRQKVAICYDTPCPVTCIAVDGEGTVWAGTPDGLMRLARGAWERAPMDAPVARALAVDAAGCLWLGTAHGLLRLGGDRAELARPGGAVSAIACAGDDLAVAGDAGVAVLRAGMWQELGAPGAHSLRDVCLGADGGVSVATDAGLFHWAEGCWTATRAAEAGLLSDDVRAVALDAAGHLWVGTARGISLTDGKGWWHAIGGREGLPHEDVRCLRLGPDGACWVGTPRGAARLKDGRWEYFAGRRWLPEDSVRALCPAPDGGAWIATDGGLARIEYRPMTLAEKAAVFEERVAARHERLGYVTSCRLERSGDLDSFCHEASDNDGLWTALYIAAQSFQYAVTRDPGAKARARRSLEALMRLEAVTGMPGFPARAAVRKGERVVKSDGEWHDSADGEWEWKGDTSSDEIDGHLFAYGIYFDLVADDAEKQEIAAVVGRILSHIVDHGFLLVDLDGKHTRWGVWNPRLLNDDPNWAAERGLNSLEILAHLKTATHVTGDARFQGAYRRLVEEEHYALNTIPQKLTQPGHVNHSDDELAFISYYPLLRYEEDPALRALYLASLERSWQIERPERCPLWNIIYGALTGCPCDADESIRALQQIPMDLVDWGMRNSHRADVTLDEEAGRFGEAQSVAVLPPDERAVMKWNGNPYRLDGGGDGRSEDDGTFFLLPYWMGRYWGLVG